MQYKLILSNCLVEAIKHKIINPKGKIRYDFNSPSGSVSFYFEINGEKWRFRRKIRRHGNKSKILFWGYKYIEKE